MFDLNNEINNWCRDVVDCGCGVGSNVDELKDHLYCLVEEKVTLGRSEQEAFTLAIQQMGERKLIAAEYFNNQTPLQKIAGYDRKIQKSISRRFSVRQLIWFTLAYSIAIAIFTLVAAAIYGGNSELISLLMLVWFVPLIFVASSPEVRKAECAFFKKVYASFQS